MAGYFRHRVETPLPLKADDGRVEIAGWCVAEASLAVPEVKAVWSHGELPIRQRLPRPDLARGNEGAPPDGLWGFVLSGELPPGAHLLTLVAAEPGKNAWHRLQRLTVVVSSRGLRAHVEYPAKGDIRESVRIQGWCLHPQKRLKSVWLHYGTRKIACEYGLPRQDVPVIAPTAPNAAQSGFITVKNIAAGRGLLRVVGLDLDDVRHVARTDRFVDINRDEENPAGLNLPERLARLPPVRRGVSLPGSFQANQPRSPSGLRILFVLYGDLTSNSALHVTALANAMIDAGHECIIAVPENPETISRHRGARFTAVAFNSVPLDGTLFREGRPPDVLHAWTTRESVRHFCARLRQATGAKLIVHLEDNEQQILEKTLRQPLDALLRLPEDQLDRSIGASLSHPHRGLEFLHSADGISVIIEKLHELVPPKTPSHVFWPAADATAFFPRPIPHDLRLALGWDSAHTVLFYHGNVHAANQQEVGELYAAVTKLNAAGRPTTLLRCGRDSIEFTVDRTHVISLGEMRNHHIASLMALADFFVQPGEADAFNEYRFPSKLPEFFALGRPVIVPRTNLGHRLRHGQDAYVLEKADAPGIAGAVQTLIADPELRERLSAGAVAFAQTHFNWKRAADGLLRFYEKLMAARSDQP